MTLVPMTESASRKGSVMRKSLVLAFAVAVGALCGAENASAQGVFTLSSTSFKDGERLATKILYHAVIGDLIGTGGIIVDQFHLVQCIQKRILLHTVAKTQAKG